MDEALRVAQEAECLLAAGVSGQRFVLRTVLLQGAFEDVLDPPDVDQVVVEGAAAGGIDPCVAVLVRQAEQLLRLSQVGPREGA